ncbi:MULTISPECIES: outer membrane protein assembly factor BamE [Marinobacter]|uniref:Outer membrane protein assembly factor BamE n=1 Tax=Marinobacter suaedae TaxID=3057675 RepID=A0ABT8W2L4_9GAMM|nr:MULTISPECIES: outer membrane protein assembly factor BamE [unclassified Marinobacter]MBZ2167783.1 outer membrane protein assembly factor BamE [Marinobacter sp. F4216]MDO3722485.1 outer membrane protein assembly factor BamE [Marinobacter sp. chi1]
MKKNKTLLSSIAMAAILALAPAGSAVAEQIAVPVGSQADRSGTSTPSTGMTKESVRAKWGSPQDIQGPVGEPPISQWHYQGFIVYFEHDRVLHSVLKPNR